ncbi:MAG: hypothetical protein Ct9H300mP1_06980 [Planctomycetaceae bacterium]|nr:MAG: hypothetical protein Ct9H300mP1_06980 [Planctomycetaceae bacterium]
MSLAALLAGIGSPTVVLLPCTPWNIPRFGGQDVPGRGKGLLLPYVMDFNRHADPDTLRWWRHCWVWTPRG